MLRLKLDYIPEWLSRRRDIARFYDQKLKGVSQLYGNQKTGHGFHLYVIKVSNRDDVLDSMQKRKIQCQVHYPLAVDQQVGYKTMFQSKNELCYVAYDLSGKIMSLPIHPFLTETDISRVVDQLNEVLSEN